MKRLYVYLSVFTIFLTFLSCSSDDKTLKLTPSKLDFKEVYLGNTSDIEITILNKYGKDVKISSFVINGSSNYSITAGALSSPVTLAKDEEYKLTITFEPDTGGLIEGTLEITHDGSTKPKNVSIRGVGVPAARIELNETSYDFGKKLINKTFTHDFTIKNIGTADLIIDSFTFTGANAALYSITSAAPPLTIVPSASETITITFAPLAIGVVNADLEIGHNAVNEATPLVYSILAEAIDKDPQITLSVGSSWDFGAVATTMPAMQWVEIENSGIDPLTVTSGVLTNSSEFTILHLKDGNYNTINFPYQLAVGEKIYLWIKFSPSAKTNFNDTLTFVHDGTNEPSPLAIPLTGSGRDEITKTFTYTGAAEQFVIPAGVATIKVELLGAAGGNGYPYSTGNTDGGKGGQVTAEFSVSPGVTLNIYVGGKGSNGSSSSNAVGGWNGGGTSHVYSGSLCGGGGGGASDIRIGGTTYAKRIVVAGGGGGSGSTGNPPENGGVGGGLIGGDGYIVGTFLDNYCGKGGSQTAGGAAALGGGQPGTLGEGGDGDSTLPGGGGGGGYYGGGGAYYGGAGGGSSYLGSGSNTTNVQGVQAGDGEIKITY